MSTQSTATTTVLTAQERASGIIRRLMAMNGETQRTLAEVLHLSAPSLSDRFNGGSRWTLDEVDQLAVHYGVSQALFFEHPDNLMARVQNLK